MTDNLVHSKHQKFVQNSKTYWFPTIIIIINLSHHLKLDIVMNSN